MSNVYLLLGLMISLLVCAPVGTGIHAQTVSYQVAAVDPVIPFEVASDSITGPYVVLSEVPPGCETGGMTTPVRNVDPRSLSAYLRVYPNPLTTYGNVSVPSTDRDFDLLLLDGMGRSIWRGRYAAGTVEPIAWDVPAVPPGVYLLRWTTVNGEQATARVMVAR